MRLRTPRKGKLAGSVEPLRVTLTLSIDGQSYTVHRPQPWLWVLAKLPGPELYYVERDRCSCPAARFSAAPCKHRLALEQLRLLEG